MLTANRFQNAPVFHALTDSVGLFVLPSLGHAQEQLSLEANGITMSYVEEGTGEPVVFLHGAVADARVWEAIRPLVSDQFHFIALTLRYHGTGDWPDEGGQFSTVTHADDVVAFIEALALGPVDVVGWSYGGEVALAAALQKPDLFKSLVLYEASLGGLIPEGAAGDAVREALDQMLGSVPAALEEGDVEKATRLLVEGVFQMEPGGFGSLPQELQDTLLANARTMPLLWAAPPWAVTCEMLGQIDTPTLLVGGADSNAAFVDLDVIMDECMPQAERATMPGVNHNGPAVDPVGLAQLIKNFVASH